MLRNKIQVVIFFVCIFFIKQSSFAAPEVVGAPEGTNDPAPEISTTTTITTTTLPLCSTAGALVGGGGCCAGLHIVSGTCCDVLSNYLVFGICSPCPSGETACGGNCYGACPVGQSRNAGTCACECTTAGQTLCGGACYGTCPAGQTRNTTTCVCECNTAGQTVCGGTCYAACPAGQTRNTTTCVCECNTAGQTVCGGTCYAACPAGQTRNAACVCACPTGQSLCGGTCYSPCTGGQTRNAACVCACPTGQSLCSGTCYGACTVTGQVRNTTTCVCACPTATPTTCTNNNTCVATPPTCTSPKVLNSSCNSCACPTGTIQATNNSGKCCDSTTPYWSGSSCIACNYYKGSVTYSGTSDTKSFSTSSFSRTGDTTSTKLGWNSTLSCFDSLLTTALTTWFEPPGSYARKCDTCRGTGSDGTLCKTGAQYMDDCVAWYLCYIYLGQMTTVNWPSASTFYFDDSCQAIPSGSIPSTCRTAATTNFDYQYYGSSPISLIWDNSADVEGILSYVDFPLDPTKNNKSWIWKASAKTPLLVYDPEHQGVITSAEQLFGNWTFGGSKVASLITGSKSPQTSRWENGYEALKTLDLNFDTVISGEELKFLGLWFDNNQDGVSQLGEVKSLADAGVTKLYTSPSYTDPQTGNVQARLGFEREENGRTIQGSSIDWYTQGADSVDQLHDKYFALGVLKSALDGGSKGESQTGSENEKKIYDIDSLWIKATELSGIWSYRLDGTAKGRGGKPGKFEDVMLVFTELDDNKIQGGTFTQIGVQTKALNFTNMTRIAKLQGTKVVKEDGTISIEFTVSNEDGSTLKNYASLSKNGKTLKGSSSIDFEQDGKPKNLKYKWEAYKFNVETLLKKK